MWTLYTPVVCVCVCVCVFVCINLCVYVCVVYQFAKPAVTFAFGRYFRSIHVPALNMSLWLY